MASVEFLNKHVDIPMLLEKLGADTCNIKQLYGKLDYRCNCWYRGGDNNHSLGITYYKSKGKWIVTDFIHKSVSSCDLFDFVSHVTGLEFKQALKVVESCCTGSNCDSDINSLISEQNAIQSKIKLNKNVLDCFEYGLHPYLYKRGYTPETAKYFHLGYSNTFELIDRIVIPIFDENNELVSVQGRTFENEEPKYKFINGTGENAKQTLYNYTGAVDVAKRKGWVLVVEGATSVWRLHQYGMKNVVATMSTSVTDNQIKLLTELGLHIIIFFDWDNNMAGQFGTMKLVKKFAELHYTNVSYIKARKEGSPDDFTKDEIRNMFMNNRTFPFKRSVNK